MQNLGTLRKLFLGDLADDGRREREREEEEKIMPSLMATSLRWRTHSARTKNAKRGCRRLHGLLKTKKVT
jgi:hypothetical protein